MPTRHSTDVLADAPASIRKHLEARPGAAKIMASQIRAAIHRTHSKLENRMGGPNPNRITSDDISEAMMPFLADIERLRDLPGSTVLAFDLTIELGEHSYADLGSMNAAGYSERPSDEEVDDLLLQLAPERRDLEPEWNFPKVLKTLKRDAENLSKYSIENYCTGTIELLEEWKAGLPEGATFASETRRKSPLKNAYLADSSSDSSEDDYGW